MKNTSIISKILIEINSFFQESTPFFLQVRKFIPAILDCDVIAIYTLSSEYPRCRVDVPIAPVSPTLNQRW